MGSGNKSYPVDQPIVPMAKDNEAPTSVSTRRAIKEPSDMSEVELLTVLLGRSLERACQRLVNDHRTLRQLGSTHLLNWRDAGLTETAISRLEAVFEIAKRYGETQWIVGEPFRGSGDIYGHYRERLATATREEFYGLMLDNKHRKLKDVLLSIGSLTSSVVHPREVYSRVIRESAAAVLFVHNHPSGDPTPSVEDLALTRRLREVGDLVGVRVLDHIIIGKGRYVSFVDDGYW